MSSIYDNIELSKSLDGGKTVSPAKKTLPSVEEQSQKKFVLSEANKKELAEYKEHADNALRMVDDIVMKQYLSKLSEMNVVSLDKPIETDNIILFKINKMAYEKEEFANEKFISVISAMTYTSSTVFMIVDGYKEKTDFYLGIKCEDESRTINSIAETLKNSLLGQFPGVQIDDNLSIVDKGESISRQDKLLASFGNAVSVSSCVGVPSYKDADGNYTNASFVQGIEKFATAMQGKRYTAIILASNTVPQEISLIRNSYENIYTELSAMATRQLAYATNESLSEAFSRSKGVSHATTNGTTDTHTSTKSMSTGVSEDNMCGKISKIGGPLLTIGAVLTGTGLAAPLGIGLMAAGGAASLAGLGAKQHSKNNTESTSNSLANMHSDTQTETVSDTYGNTFSVGGSKTFTVTVQNKHIQEIQKRIDKQLERLEMCESTGLWSASAYFLSYGTDRYVAETGATIFRSIMQGEQSGVESSAISTWYDNQKEKFPSLVNYARSLAHPLFNYSNKVLNAEMQLQATSFLSSKELAMMMGLPRKSVPGFPVVEHCSLAKEVVRLDSNDSRNRLYLGNIFDQGIERKENKVWLDTKSLTQHTFVTGSTGSGKSNTIYYLINQIRNQGLAPKFLVIEPAKGEYKDVFGNEHIYGTNPLKTPLLKINPFKFAEGVHVLEHIDRLIEIFNVCWPMYAAMPAVLKEAMLNAYEKCGWDMYKSDNKYSRNLFPSFADLLNELEDTIQHSAYSEEVKSNYQGSLVTRVKSLNNGLCREIFSDDELGDQKLFDENVIVDLSRIGSQETKALIMGILIMRLNEYRSNSNIPHNSALRHITILEEAHNILKKCSQEQSAEGSNVAGKSVEMISNSIAEMRTYGEGFIIVDQSPSAVDVSAIRNTNTKVIMRLPEDTDRHIAGKASALKDNQIDEIAKLPTGVAVVYQNNWEEPVLCKIGKYEEKEIPFTYLEGSKETEYDAVKLEVLKFLLNGRISKKLDFDVSYIKNKLASSDISTSNKARIFESLTEYEQQGTISLWKDANFAELSQLVTEIISAKSEVKRIVKSFKSFDALNRQLGELVHGKLPNVAESLVPTIFQCLMRNYSFGGEACKKIYSTWIQLAAKKKTI